MAKYNITYSCGHEGTVQLFGKSEERERKIKYYEEFGLCTECYKKQKQEENAKLGFLIGGSVADTLSEKGEIQICLSFAGDTLPHKEEIKTLGYRWTAVDASQMAYMHKPDMGWVKVVPYEHLEEEKEKAFAIGAKEAEVSDRELANQKERYQEMLSEQKLFRKHNKLIFSRKSRNVSRKNTGMRKFTEKRENISYIWMEIRLISLMRKQQNWKNILEI